MRRQLLFVLFLLLPLPVLAQKIYIYPSSVNIPNGSYQVVTAIVSDVSNKTVTWSASGGKLIGANPCTDAMTAPCTIALYSKTKGIFTVTATSNSDRKTAINSTITFIESPKPIVGHPRLYFTEPQISALQAKASLGGDVWVALQLQAEAMAQTADAGWSETRGGGGYSCDGGTGVPSPAYIDSDESVAWGGPKPGVEATVFALMSNIDPNATSRPRWRCRAHDVYLYYMQELLKTSCKAGICNANILAGNQGGDWGPGIGLTLDWIYGSFSPEEKSVILKAHRKAAKMLVTQDGISSGHPKPIGKINNPELATSYEYLRTTGNNYFSLHLNQLTSIGAAWDPVDDPTQTHCPGGRDTVCPDGSANSIHAYLSDAMGAYLYLMWLNYDDPAITTTAYNSFFGSKMSATHTCSASSYVKINTICYGNGRGGLSHEGAPLYIGSMNQVREAFTMLHTAGLDDPLVFGPQLSFATSSWWDMSIQGLLHSMVPVRYENGGASYQMMFAYNEVNATYDLTDFVGQQFGQLLFYDHLTGRTDRTNSLGWIEANLAIQYPYSTLVYNTTWLGIDGFFYLPNGKLFSALGATDPRGSMPLQYYSLNAGRLIAGTGWGKNDTIFESLCSIYPTQDHELGTCGRFGLYYKGDYVTKGVDGYAENDQSGELKEELPDYSNMAAYDNSPKSAPSSLWYIDPLWKHGGQSNHGMGNGINVVLHSEMPSYVFEHLDATGGYNFAYPNNPKTDIRHASRDFFWIKPHYLVIYDRGVTGHDAAKRVWFNATGTPTISGQNISWNSQFHKSSAYLHSLLPIGATISNQPFEVFGGERASQDYAPQTRILIDGGSTISARFLNVLEAQDYGASAAGVTLLESSSGTAFDGSLIATTIVMFRRNMSDSFTAVTYPASGAKTHFVLNLMQNTRYAIAGDGAPPNAVTDSAGVLEFSATGTGNITISGSAHVLGLTPLSTMSGTNPNSRIFSKSVLFGCVVIGCFVTSVWRANREKMIG
jgi:hypothetical protein